MIPALNLAVLSLAPAFEARDLAPATFADLHRAPGLVWAGASDRTIFGDARVNWAFRAWHDACHLKGEHDFTPAGEAATCALQIRELFERFPSAPPWAAALLDAEVNGQVRYLLAHGRFPEDQSALTLDLIRQSGYSLRSS